MAQQGQPIRAASPGLAITTNPQGKSLQLVNAAQLANFKNAATNATRLLHAQRINANTTNVKIAAAAAAANNSNPSQSNNFLL